MNIPDICPKCGARWRGEEQTGHLLIRTELDFDSESDEGGRIEDQIYECSECHTLFRVKWQLVSFKELVEKEEKE